MHMYTHAHMHDIPHLWRERLPERYRKAEEKEIVVCEGKIVSKQVRKVNLKVLGSPGWIRVGYKPLL